MDSSTLMSLKRSTEKDYQLTVKGLIRSGVLSPETKSLYIYNKEILVDRLDHLSAVFPKDSLHAVAIKSNSNHEVLKEIVNQGHGLEAASYEEVLLAHKAGCPNEKIVFDSPVKTIEEIHNCNQQFPSMILNANCFQELERLKGKNNVRIGIRINPLIKLDNPGIYDVSGNNSKFGIPISQKEKIIQYALHMPNCEGLHIHAGSEIGSEENHIRAIGSIVDIAEEIRLKGKKLAFIDIGGGVPARMESGSQKGLEYFYDKLRQSFPAINNYKMVTEYGRFVQAHTAFVISKVEYLLDHCEPNIALIHVGADLFPREIYSTHPPHHDVFVLDQEGNLKDEQEADYDIGGPLCFSGDFIKRNISLPKIESGDLICIADTGANTLSMWSRHCSRNEVEFFLYA